MQSSYTMAEVHLPATDLVNFLIDLKCVHMHLKLLKKNARSQLFSTEQNFNKYIKQSLPFHQMFM